MNLITLRDAVSKWGGDVIGAVACTFGYHPWVDDDPPEGRPVYLHRRRCPRCPAKQGKSVSPNAEWRDM